MWRGGKCECKLPKGEAEKGPEKVKVPQRACVDSFVRPEDGAAFEPKLTEKNGKYEMGLDRSFDMIVKFKEDDSGCNCSYGEYRQFISGQFYGVREISDERYVWDEIEHETAEGPIKPTEFREDTKVAEKRVFAYGHRYRDKARAQLLDNTDADEYHGDRATSCEYFGTDRPRVMNIDPTTTGYVGYVLMLTFRGEAWDIPNRKMLEPRTWTVHGGSMLDGTSISFD